MMVGVNLYKSLQMVSGAVIAVTALLGKNASRASSHTDHHFFAPGALTRASNVPPEAEDVRWLKMCGRAMVPQFARGPEETS